MTSCAKVPGAKYNCFHVIRFKQQQIVLDQSLLQNISCFEC